MTFICPPGHTSVREVVCITCGKEFLKYRKPNCGRRAMYNIRGFNTINCSKKCSVKHMDLRKTRRGKK